MRNLLNTLMIKTTTIAIVFGLAMGANADDPDKMPEAITVLKKFADATGGAANYKKVKALKMVGKVEIAAAGISGTLEVIQVAPNMIATKAEMPQVGSQSQGTNGEVGWDISTMMGPRLLEDKELERLQDQANLARIYEPEKYYKEMKVVGIEEIRDQKCYKMKLTKKNGDQSTEYYAVDSGMQICSESTMETQMGAIEIKSFVSDYNEVGGIKLPHKIEAEFPNGISQLVTFETVEVNPELDKAAFAVPDEIKALMPKEEGSAAKEESGDKKEGSAAKEEGSGNK